MLTHTEWVIYTAVASYSACFMSIQPLHLFYVEGLTAKDGSSSSSFATLKTLMAIAQLIGSLYVGTLTDRMGGKRALLLALGSSALSYALTAYATSMYLLYLAQIPTVFQHGVLAARAYMTSTLSPKERAVALGRLSSAYAGGMLVGPALGGFISQHWGLPATGILATLLSLATLLLVLVALPNTVPTVEVVGGGVNGVVVLSTMDSTSPISSKAATSLDDASASLSPSSSSSSSTTTAALAAAPPLPPPVLHHQPPLPPPGYMDLLAVPGVPWALCIKGVFSLSSTLFQFIFTLVAVRSWGFGAGDMGGVMALIGGSMGVANLVVVPLLKEAKEGGVLVGSALGLAACLALLPLAHSKAAVYALCAPQAGAATVWGVVQGALMSKLSPAHLQGSLNALDMCLRSGTSIVAPWLGTHILEVWGDAGGCLIPAALMVVCAGMQVMEGEAAGGVGGRGGLRVALSNTPFVGGILMQQLQQQQQQQQQQHISSGEEEDRGGSSSSSSSREGGGEGDELLEKAKPRHKKVPYHSIA